MTSTEPTSNAAPRLRGDAGIPVDTYGGPTVDPTANVLQLVDAAVTRINDLLADLTKYMEHLLSSSVTRLDDLREVESRRLDQQTSSESSHIREIMSLRAEYDRILTDIRAEYEKELKLAESKRIDDIRAVDVAAVAVANQRAVEQATVLQTQVATTAETLRQALADAATTTAAQLVQIIAPITEQISKLQQAQYEGVGKSGVTDPAMLALTSEVRSLAAQMQAGAGAKQGAVESRSNLRLDLGTIISLVLAVVVIVGFVLTNN